MNKGLDLKETEKEGLKVGIRKDGKSYSVRDDRSRIFTPDEWNRFFNSLKENQKPLFDCLIQSGARISEVLSLKKRNINFKEKMITFEVVKGKGSFSDGNKRTIKISTQYLKRLEKYCENLTFENYLFIDNKKLPKDYFHWDNSKRKKYYKIKSNAPFRLMKRKLIKAGIKDWYNFSLHNIRKSSECWLNYLGNNHLILLKHFGHDKCTALKHYINSDTYNHNYKFKARLIMGDLYI